jgi:hypothetical protein
MAEAKPAQVENEQKNEELGAPALDIEHDRDTFLPGPSDSPNDPLNWSIYLKVTALFVTDALAMIDLKIREPY